MKKLPLVSNLIAARRLAAVAVLLLVVALAPTAAAATIPIADARVLPLGTEVTVEGSVSVPSGAFTSSTFDQGFGVQDQTAGIYVSLQTDLGLKFFRRVRVTGVLDDDGFGILVIRPASPDAVELLGGATPITPLRVPTGAIGEATEGLLVEVVAAITRPIVDDRPFGYQVFVDDGSGETQVFVPVTSGIDPLARGYLEVGRVIRATGQSGQFLSQYEVLTRFPGDLRPGR